MTSNYQRISRTHAYRGVPRKSTVRILNPFTRRGTGTCAVCHLETGLEEEGSTILRPHTVGSNRANSWPCPGRKTLPVPK